MTLVELETIVAAGESEQVEFKASTGQRTRAAESVCAMLNGSGGFVLFGISNDGTITGQDVSTRTFDDLVHELHRIEPRPLINPERVDLENGKTVIVVRVPANTGPTYQLDGRTWIRHGPRTILMPREEYERRLLENMRPSQRWENLAADGLTIADLDHAEITRTLDEAIRRQRVGEPGTRDPEAVLRGLGLLTADGGLLNAAVVLFVRADRVMPASPQCLLRLARFRGHGGRTFDDSRQEFGNVFFLLQAAQRFLRQHLPVAGRVLPGLFEREDDPLYPPEALREALVNAFCHRDYSRPGGSVGVAIYDDRLEIRSTGELPPGLTPESLMRPHASQPRNPSIASVLFRRGMIEQWGLGTIKMAELTQQAGLAPPEINVRHGEVVVTFTPSGYTPPPKVDHELTSFQQRILEILADLGAVPSSRIRERLDERVSETRLLQNLHLLQHLGLVSKSGNTRGARWSITGRGGSVITISPRK